MKRVICVGSGLASINFVNNLPEHVELIWVLGKGSRHTNSYLAKGGIAISSLPEDLEEHIADTLVAGAGLCNKKIVKEVLGNSGEILNKLKKEGVLFDEVPGKEGGHSRARIQHVSDQTGKFLVDQFWQQALKRNNTQLMFDWIITDLIVEDDVCDGVIVSNLLSGEQLGLYADAVILATGGAGNLYQYHTNSPEVNGEGYAIAKRAGAKMADMEFIQFHPTKLYAERGRENVLVTEAFRGAGAKLIGENGKEFMNSIHAMGSLAPRDVVSLGIYKQMLHDDSPYVWLDYSNLDEVKFKEDFPYLYGVIFHKSYKAEKRIPVTPAAHYLCGGVDVDANSRASVLGLYAIGEIARTGLHGANRLASNSLLELFYFSQKLAQNISNELVGGWCEVERLPKLDVNCSFDLKPYMAELKLIMWEHFGIIRTPGQMFNGLTKLNKMHYDLVQTDEASLPYKRFINSLETAILIATSAIEQKESIGCHQLKQVKFELTTA